MSETNKSTATPMFDGVFTKKDTEVIYRIVEITEKNGFGLKELIPKAYHYLIGYTYPFIGRYIVENPPTARFAYEHITKAEVEGFTKLDKDTASRILCGGLLKN